ncbi:hypothetical protein CERSUDRAFT_113779 [Gelatoporia subvermispora B]|uniref:PPPDE domain-containing protein n=1 Tax=Ceriporiopsis subvermispora (strain B) TaxID=914234 RepID=M2RJE9_CERS8|nr:hypothetical protein CERSUDRAFT_113779 [Gelatoporia subvermispora B]
MELKDILFDLLPEKVTREDLAIAGVLLPKGANVVPYETPRRDDEPRKVYVACAPMDINQRLLGDNADFIATFAERLGLEAPPNPTFHWAVIVGDYVHELDYDDTRHRCILYQTQKYVPKEWRINEVGTTRFSDYAIVEAGQQGIDMMRPKYNVWDNNCQKLVINILDLICEGGRQKLWTTFAWDAIESAETDSDSEEHPPVEPKVSYVPPAGHRRQVRPQLEGDEEEQRAQEEEHAKMLLRALGIMLETPRITA